MRIKRRKQNNIFSTIALISAIVMITLLPLPVAHAANFAVSKSNVSLEVGQTSTITINAPTHTGRLNIATSNSAVATSNQNSLWVENDSETITISAKAAGIATITVKGELYDSSTEEEKEFSKTIKVTVTKASNTGTTNNSGSSSGSNITGENSGGITSGSTSNNNQSTGNSSNSGTGSSNVTTSKPSSSNTTTQKPASSNNTTQKPSSSNGTTKPSNSSNTVQKPSNTSGKVQNSLDNYSNEIEEVVEIPQENIIEDSEEINEEGIIESEEAQDEDIVIDNAEEVNTHEKTLINYNGKTIIIVAVVIIAFVMTGIGIIITKKILKK